MAQSRGVDDVPASAGEDAISSVCGVAIGYENEAYDV